MEKGELLPSQLSCRGAERFKWKWKNCWKYEGFFLLRSFVLRWYWTCWELRLQNTKIKLQHWGLNPISSQWQCKIIASVEFCLEVYRVRPWFCRQVVESPQAFVCSYAKMCLMMSVYVPWWLWEVSSVIISRVAGCYYKWMPSECKGWGKYGRWQLNPPSI